MGTLEAEPITQARPKSLHVVRINVDRRYAPGTCVEGILLGIAMRGREEDLLSDTWRVIHGEEVGGLLTEKYLFSERNKQNCGLNRGVREYFDDEGNLNYMAQMAIKEPANGDRRLCLSELGIIIKEGGVGQFFLPNIDILETIKMGGLVSYKTIEAVRASEAALGLRMVLQNEAANPDPKIPHPIKTQRFNRFLKLYGSVAGQRFKEALKFGEGNRYIECLSPDELFREYTLDGEEYIPFENRDLEVVYL